MPSNRSRGLEILLRYYRDVGLLVRIPMSRDRECTSLVFLLGSSLINRPRTYVRGIRKIANFFAAKQVQASVILRDSAALLISSSPSRSSDRNQNVNRFAIQIFDFRTRRRVTIALKREGTSNYVMPFWQQTLFYISAAYNFPGKNCTRCGRCYG